MFYLQFMRRCFELTTFMGLLFVFAISTACNDQGGDGSNDGDSSSSEIETLAKAQPDECFCGIGAGDNGPISSSATGDCTDLTPAPPLTECVSKTDQSYIWALTKLGKDVWFGTLANSLCVAGSVIQSTVEIGAQASGLEDIVACEYGESKVASAKPDPELGDHRSPQIKIYDSGTGIIQDVSVDNCAGGTELLATTLGLRQGGSIDNGDFSIVILAGPSLLSGLNMFAFDGKTKLCLAAKNFPEYNDARKALVVNGVLYSAVGKSSDDENPLGGGRVLRYRGDLSDPLKWEEVGKLDTIGAAMAFHDGRLYVGTWPNIHSISSLSFDLSALDSFPRAAIFMSSVIPPEGLTNGNLNDWVKVWDASEYEPDPVIAATYAVGDLASFDGRLWWGTLHLTTAGFLAHSVFFEIDLLGANCSSDPECSIRQEEAFNNSNRALALLRGRNFDSTPEIELLYGETSLPVYDSSVGEWEEKQNNSSLIPLFGKSGIDNPNNAYTWAMAVYKDRLYLATFDASILLTDNPESPYGADLFRFSDLSSGAETVTLDGFGNPLNYGVRNMVSDEDAQDGDDALYIGTANPFNISPEGGWELLSLK